MAFRGADRNRTKNVPDDEDLQIIHDLTALLEKNGAKLLKEQTKLSLTLGTLNSLNRSLRREVRYNEDSSLDEIVSLSSLSSSSPILLKRSHGKSTLDEELAFLKDFVNRIAMVKVSQGTGTVQGSVDVSLFGNLKGLELKRVPIHLLVGLQSLRPHLKIISCFRCITLLEDLFETCGGDRCSPFSWPELLSVTLSFNTIERIDSSLRLLPMLVFLDLSHNLITDTRGLEVLTELEFLNLSYNQLQHLPTLGTRARIRLKVLSIRNNELETLEGLSSMTNLQQVDLAYNCFLDHCCLSPFLSLPLVRLICLEGNPLSFHDNHRLLTAEHMHFRSLVTFTIIDGKPLLKTEITAVRDRLSSCRSWKHNLTENYNNSSVNTVSDSSNPINSIENDFNYLSHETASDMISSGEYGPCDKSKRKSRKSPLVREVSFTEDSGIVKDEHCLVDSDTSEIAVVVEPQHRDTQQSNTADHVATKDVIEKFRKQHGSEWLIIGSKMSVLTPVNDPNESNSFGVSANDPDAVSRMEERIQRQSRMSDDVVVLNTELEPPVGEKNLLPESLQLEDAPMTLSATESTIGIPWQKQVSRDDDSDDDDEDALLPPFIVQMEKPGMDSSSTILVVVGNQDLKEKDSLTGHTIERLNLRSICSVESLFSSSTRHDDESVESPKIKITFSYVRNDRRERIYAMEDIESHQQFLAFLKPFTDAKIWEEMMSGALQCLKCSAQFSKDVAKRVLRKSNRPVNSGSFFSSSLNNSKGCLSKVNACPNCGSQLVMEIQSGGSSSPMVLNSSLPTKGTAFEGSFKGNGPQLNHSLQQRASENDIGSSQSSSGSCRTLSSDLSNSRRSGSCSIVQVEAEVHHTHEEDRRSPRISSSLPFPSNTLVGEGLRRCGSDITILSNPSQHSIMVVPNPSLENSPLDVISESSVSVLRVDSDFQATPQNFASDRGVPLLASGSSDSLTDSACTALERTVYDSTLPRTPDSFLSALSGREKSLVSPGGHLCPIHVESIDENISSSRTSGESSCAPVALESTLNVPSSAVAQREQLCEKMTWSCRNAAVEYSFVDFLQVDHRLRLYLDIEVLDVTEELVALLRVGIAPYFSGEEWPGLLVISQSKVHILKITKEETDQPFEWLQKYETLPLDLLKHLNIRLGNQAFQLEFGPKTAPVCFTFIVRDANHCNNFVTYILEKFRSGVLNIPNSEFESGLDGDETLQTIREHLLHWKPKCFLSSASFDDDENVDFSILLYLMCYWIPPGGNDSYEPISIVMTSTDIYLVSEDLHWPLPHLILPPTDVLSRPQMTPFDRKKIQDVTAMEQMEEHPLEITLIFLNEDTQEEISMKIATETEESLNEFVQAIKDPWENLFGVNLQINILQKT